MLRFTGERGRRLQRGERGTKGVGAESGVYGYVHEGRKHPPRKPQRKASGSHEATPCCFSRSLGTMHGARDETERRGQRDEGRWKPRKRWREGGRRARDRLKSLPAPSHSLSPLYTAPRITSPRGWCWEGAPIPVYKFDYKSGLSCPSASVFSWKNNHIGSSNFRQSSTF